MRERYFQTKISNGEFVRPYVLAIFVDKMFACKLISSLVIKSIKQRGRNARVPDSLISCISFITIVHSISLMYSLEHGHNT